MPGMCSHQFLSLINRFGANKGFDSLLKAMEVDSNFTLEQVIMLMKMFAKPVYMYHREWIQSYAVELIGKFKVKYENEMERMQQEHH